jgi:homoserine O-acetyltransferase
MKLGGSLPGFQIAYETWGRLSPARDNAILLTTGLSPGSHARSHPGDPAPGWWEEFVGPGLALDTNRWFVVCSNVLGGCAGSTGPASIDRAHGPALRPELSQPHDRGHGDGAARAAAPPRDRPAPHGDRLVDGRDAVARVRALFPDDVAHVVAISAAGRSYPWSIAIRFVQRQAVLSDPEWMAGEYYGSRGPLNGLHVARQLGTISYRGPGNGRRGSAASASRRPVSRRSSPIVRAPRRRASTGSASISRSSPISRTRGTSSSSATTRTRISTSRRRWTSSTSETGHTTFEEGVGRIKARALVVGVPTDLLFPIALQKELADALARADATRRTASSIPSTVTTRSWWRSTH